MVFTEKDYATIHAIVFSGNYPGYRPNIIESPNGDEKLDAEKRYAHIAEKYLAKFEDEAAAKVLRTYLDEAHELSLAVAKRAGVPDAFLPVKENAALRILEYPPGAVSNPHTDFDLFTLMLYRDTPENFVYTGEKPEACVRELNEQVHYGEMMEEIEIGLASPHEVLASDKPQHSAVYFSIPDYNALFPSGVTVGEWLEERINRSRYDKVPAKAMA